VEATCTPMEEGVASTYTRMERYWTLRNNITMFLYISIFDDPTRRDYRGRTCDSMIVSPDESDVGEGDLDSGCDRCR
jgi:hypothetical protein